MNLFRKNLKYIKQNQDHFCRGCLHLGISVVSPNK